MDESALVRSVAAGDARSFERLYELYERRVFAYVRSFLRDATVAEEVVVDVMLAVWNGARRYENSARVSTWIFGIARHKALDAVRRLGRHGGSVALDQAEEVASTAGGPDDAAEQDSLTTVMERALERLSPDHREILWLAFFEDLPYAHIADLLSLPLNTVKTRVHYAKQNLKGILPRLTAMGPLK